MASLSTLPAPAPGHPLQGQATALTLEAIALRQRADRLEPGPAEAELRERARQLRAHADRLARRILADQADQAEQRAAVAAALAVCARALGVGPDDGDDDPPPVEAPDETEYDGGRS